MIGTGRGKAAFKMVCAALLMALLTSGLALKAQDTNPIWNAGNNMHIEILGVQWAMAEHDTRSAESHVTTAMDYYEQDLRPLLLPDVPALVTAIDADFVTIHEQIQADNAVGLALSTSRLWTWFLQAVTQMTLLSIQRNDGESALDWLLLREARPSDNQNPIRLDATSEVYALIGQRRDLNDVYSAVRAELYDTYQARLNEALTKADGLEWDNNSSAWAEQAGLAAGYFAIIAPSYQEQHGQADAAELQTTFDTLTKAAVSADRATYSTTRQKIASGLDGFTAAPMTDLELSRTAGLMMRYLTLIPVEYSESVSGGELINSSDYQQAVVYLEQARMIFTQLEPSLQTGFSNEARATITTQFEKIDRQMQSYADPVDMQTSVFALTQTVGDILPVKWRSISSASDIQAIRAVLNQVQVSVLSGEYEIALTTCVGAYALLQQTLGQKLLAFAPEIALKLDSLLWQGEPGSAGLALLIANGASVSEIEREIARLDAVLDEAELILEGTSSSAVVLGNTAIIVFREGLEAILILVALLGNLREAATRRIRYGIWIGAALACVAAVFSGWLITRVLNAFVSQQNQLVALVSLLAVVVMLLIMNWFFHRIYWTSHLSNLHTQKARTLALGGTVGILALGFISVYREAFETTLFLQPLTLTAGSGLMLAGLAVGLLGLLIVGGLVFALNKRLPYKYMLIVTGVLMTLVLVNMVGKTVYAFQIVSWMPISPLGLVFIPAWLEDWFGVYPTWQGFILQIASVAFVVGSYFWTERQNKKRRENKLASP